MNRLRAYRDLEGINQEELGEILGDVSPTMVSALESGRRPFLGTLAPLGYGDDRFLLPPMSEPLHRQRASTKVAAKKRAKELLRLAGEIFAELVNRTENAPTLSIEQLSVPATLEELESLAVEVRCMIDYEETGPIRNLTSAVERAGVCLVPIVGLSGVDGISSWVNGVPVIGLSPNVPGDRCRFTISHELGHLVLHKQKSQSTEDEANRFAGGLLFPEAEFAEAMPSGRPVYLQDFVRLKSSWGVAVSALVYRAHELDFLDDARYRSLQIQMSKWHKSEPATFDPVYGQLFTRLVEVNGGADGVAKGLRVNQRHLAELLNWSHLRVA